MSTEGRKEGRSIFYIDTTEQLPNKLGEYHTPANIPRHPVQETECLEIESFELLRPLANSVTSADVQLQVSPCIYSCIVIYS